MSERAAQVEMAGYSGELKAWKIKADWDQDRKKWVRFCSGRRRGKVRNTGSIMY